MKIANLIDKVKKDKILLVIAGCVLVCITAVVIIVAMLLSDKPAQGQSSQGQSSMKVSDGQHNGVDSQGPTTSEMSSVSSASQKPSPSSANPAETSSISSPSYNQAPDSKQGYSQSMIMREEIDDFEYGVQLPYNRLPIEQDPTRLNSDPHYWSDSKPIYSYQSAVTASGKLAYGATTKDSDNSNFWYVYPAADGNIGGTVDGMYIMNLPGKDNYENMSLYKKISFTWKGINSEGKSVNLTISLYSAHTKKWYDVVSFNGTGGKKTVLTGDLTKIPSEACSAIEKIRFRSTNQNVGSKKDGSSYQRNDLYQIEMTAPDTLKVNSISVGGLKMDSEYLGNMKMTRWGAYSASGFYDPSDKKWKIWYGAGIPEYTASDNVYYMETTDPSKGWSTPYRCKLDDPKQELFPYNVNPAYGGDPSMIKVNGTYYMYFSGIYHAKTPDPSGRVHWNKVYLTTSKNGKDFKLVYPPVVDAVNSGSLGYGTGAPSVVYKNGTFYLYYYSQYEPQGGYFLRTSKDGINFSDATRVGDLGGDVKWVPELNKWVMCYYTEPGQGGAFSSEGVRIAVSNDGIHWTFGHDDEQLPAQDPYAVANHNPGWIGTPEGHGWLSMFLTFGNNDLPLIGEGNQMDSRQLEWSRIFFKK